jgi:hypothetical protein
MLHYLRACLVLIVVLILCVVAAPSHAQESNTQNAGQGLNADQWLIQISPYTKHYHPSVDHKNVYLIGAELYNGNSQFWGGDHSLWGLAYFSNSFGQPSAYGYYGGVFNNLFGNEKLYFKWTAGVLYGYKPPFENKVPYNRDGWSSGIVFSPGYKFTPQFSAQINALGNAGAMISFTYQFK